MSAASKIIVIGLAALAVCGCDEPPPSPAASASATASPAGSTARSSAAAAPSGSAGAAAKAPASGWKPGYTARTTSPELALRNIDKQLARADKKLEAQPDDVAAMRGVVGHLLLMSSRLGRLAGLDRAAELGERAVTKNPKDPEAYELRSSTRSAVHRFEEALADLDQAEKLGLPASKTVAARASILAGLGRFQEAHEASLKARKGHDTFTLQVFHAALVGRMGEYAEAEKLFFAAEKSFTGVSPFMLARLYFDWGSMWDRAGKHDEAEARYRAAVKRLPGYAHAVGHLAAVAPKPEAQKLLEAIVKTSDDPEYKASLGVAQNAASPGSGQALLDEATAAYDALMKKHPLAFADHAGWFYLDVVRKPDRAVEVAEMNLEARKVPEAYELAIAALVAAGERDEACARADEAFDRPWRTAALRDFAARAYDACGRKDRAAELRKKK